MVKAKIKSKNGSQIHVEGTPEEISKIILDFKKREEHLAEIRATKKSRGKNTATSSILKLCEGGFFDKSRTLFDIKDKLAENGLIYPKTTLSGVLIGLVRRRELGRVKGEKMWGYVKGDKNS